MLLLLLGFWLRWEALAVSTGGGLGWPPWTFSTLFCGGCESRSAPASISESGSRSGWGFSVGFVNCGCGCPRCMAAQQSDKCLALMRGTHSLATCAHLPLALLGSCLRAASTSWISSGVRGPKDWFLATPRGWPGFLLEFFSLCLSCWTVLVGMYFCWMSSYCVPTAWMACANSTSSECVHLEFLWTLRTGCSGSSDGENSPLKLSIACCTACGAKERRRSPALTWAPSRRWNGREYMVGTTLFTTSISCGSILTAGTCRMEATLGSKQTGFHGWVPAARRSPWACKREGGTTTAPSPSAENGGDRAATLLVAAKLLVSTTF
mmetsp:Transcript_25062/g.70000  ORF Transcript_25062/g.70000 Transcript_25062/m.70000 type:complete len:322 (-) Transcript_25062:1140-2105(-)